MPSVRAGLRCVVGRQHFRTIVAVLGLAGVSEEHEPRTCMALGTLEVPASAFEFARRRDECGQFARVFLHRGDAEEIRPKQPQEKGGSGYVGCGGVLLVDRNARPPSRRCGRSSGERTRTGVTADPASVLSRGQRLQSKGLLRAAERAAECPSDLRGLLGRASAAVSARASQPKKSRRSACPTLGVQLWDALAFGTFSRDSAQVPVRISVGVLSRGPGAQSGCPISAPISA